MLEPAFSIAAERVARYHVDFAYADLCTRIDEALSSRQFFKARNSLFAMFKKICSFDTEDDVSNDDSAYAFWRDSVQRLMREKPEMAFALSFDCADNIENNSWADEKMQVCVYTLGCSSTYMLLTCSPNYIKEHIALMKLVMQRSSEFDNQDSAQSVFCNAAEEFLKCMQLVSPSERYNHAYELSLWLEGRKHPSELLQGFVDHMLNISKTYENGVHYIPDEDDDEDSMPSLQSSGTSYLRLVYSSQDPIIS